MGAGSPNRRVLPEVNPVEGEATGVAPTQTSPEAPSQRAVSWRLILSGGLGLVGYGGMVATGTRLGPLPNPPTGEWWFTLPAGHVGLLRVLFYLAVAVAIAGWLGVGTVAWRRQLRLWPAAVILVVWSVPLLLGPPLFSKDVYSYVGQGLIAHRGLNPYVVPPAALGNGPLLRSIASVWRHSPAPYGPFFVEIARGVVSIVGGSVVARVMVMRLIEIAGMALIVVFLPKLARRLGADPGLALWLGALSPLVLLSFMASGHNDCLMVGLVVAGVELSLGGRRILGIVSCALAAMVKAPAAAAIVFLAADEILATGWGRRAAAILAKVAGVTAATVVAVTLASGLGWRWLDPANLRIPAQLRIDATPTVSVGTAVSRFLELFRIPAGVHGSISVAQTVGGLIAAVGSVWLLTRVRRDNVVRVLAVVLALVVLAGPTLWPWYLTWALVLLAATRSQRSRVLILAAALATLLAGPVGTPQLAGYWYWAVTVLTVGGCGWLLSRRRWTSVLLGRSVATRSDE